MHCRCRNGGLALDIVRRVLQGNIRAPEKQVQVSYNHSRDLSAGL